MCREPLQKDDLLKLPAGVPDTVPTNPNSVMTSSKIVELIRLLKAREPSDKTLVFSQWTSMLDLVLLIINCKL